jgi:hypothetical protein
VRYVRKTPWRADLGADLDARRHTATVTTVDDCPRAQLEQFVDGAP